MIDWHKKHYLDVGLTKGDWQQVIAAENEGMTDMAQVERFEDKVKTAISAAMQHAIAGHDSTEGSKPAMQGGYHRYCTNADHALHILAEHGIRPVNDAVASRILDNPR